MIEQSTHFSSYKSADQTCQACDRDIHMDNFLPSDLDNQNGQLSCAPCKQILEEAAKNMLYAHPWSGAHLLDIRLESSENGAWGLFVPAEPRCAPFPFNLRSASPQVDSDALPYPQHESDHLSQPMQRGAYSSSSCASEASSLKSDTSDVLYCNENGCAASSTGSYRKGNLARHKRLIHSRHEPYLCESAGCGRSFKRQDARLKHYRKHHPRLSAEYLPRGPRARPPGGDHHNDLRDISGAT
jgi:hypothetical protein